MVPWKLSLCEGLSRPEGAGSQGEAAQSPGPTPAPLPPPHSMHLQPHVELNSQDRWREIGDADSAHSG